MVSHHEILIWRDNHVGHRTDIAEALGNIRFVDTLAIDEDAAVIDADVVAWQPDDALDVALLRVAWIVENDHIATRNLFEVISKFIDEEPVLVAQFRLHAGAFDLHRLVQKGDDEK